MTWFLILIATFAAAVAVLLLPPLRRTVFTGPIFAIYKKMLPAMSQTEKEALEAGTVWWDGELFSGKPDWAKLLSLPRRSSLPRSRPSSTDPSKNSAPCSTTGISGTTAPTCRPRSGQFLKDKGFLRHDHPEGAMAASNFRRYAQSHGGAASSSSRSLLGRGCVTVMVPNSLGPGRTAAEKYGTRGAEGILPRRAWPGDIDDSRAFALTSPHAGSDAAGDARPRHRLQGPCGKGREVARHEASPGTSATSRWAPVCDDARPGLPPPRPRAPARRGRGRPRHHAARSCPTDFIPASNIGRRHYPAQCRLP
jgi:acyl-CoA dehydrogenase